MKRNNIRIALQKDGRLKEASLAVLSQRGLPCNPVVDRSIIAACPGTNIEILYVRNCDIPEYVRSGAADFGIVGQNTLYEGDAEVAVLEKLDFARCRLVIAVPEDSPIQAVVDLDGERIATSYPNTLRKVLRQAGINAAITTIAGSVEAAPALGLADAICDITQTGTTLKANNLREVTTLLRSQAVLIESPFTTQQKEACKEQYSFGKQFPKVAATS